MKLIKLSMLAAAISVASAPVIASAQNVAPASVSRSAASQGDENSLDSSGMVIVALAAAAVVGAIILAVDNDNDAPASA